MVAVEQTDIRKHQWCAAGLECDAQGEVSAVYIAERLAAGHLHWAMSQKHIITQSTWQYASFGILCSFTTGITIVYVQNMMDLLPAQRSHKNSWTILCNTYAQCQVLFDTCIYRWHDTQNVYQVLGLMQMPIWCELHPKWYCRGASNSPQHHSNP